MARSQVLIIVVTICAVLGWMGVGACLGRSVPSTPLMAGELAVSSAANETPAGAPGVAPPSAPEPTSIASTASGPNAGAEMAAKALAATRAAGLNPDLVYVPRPSATPTQLAEAAAKGAAAPLYTGSPAPMGLADYGLSTTGNVYVGEAGSDTVSVINGATNTVVATIPVGDWPNDMSYDGLDSEIFVANSYSNNVSVISVPADTVVASIPVGVNPYAATYDAGNGNVYVPNNGSDNVSVISAFEDLVIGSVSVGSGPCAATYDSGTGNVYVSNDGSDTVSVISGLTNTVIATVSVGHTPCEMAYDSANGDIYVTDYFANNVSVVSGATNTVVATIPAGVYPNSAAYDGANGDVYVSNRGSGNVSVISGATNTVIASVSTGQSPTGVAYDPENGDVYASNYLSNDSSVISGVTNTVVDTIPLGSGPFGALYGGGAYTLNTTEVTGYVDTNSTGIVGQDLYNSLPDGFSIQLNAVLTNITLFGTPGYQFWAQDIVTYFPATGYMILVTNVWNFSAPLATMTANTLAAIGPYGHSDYSTLGYYYANYAVPYRVSYPFSVDLEVQSGLFEGNNQVDFSTDVVSDNETFPEIQMYDFDDVVFDSTGLGGIPPVEHASNFTASGFGYNRVGELDDFELVICGPGGGSQVDLSHADATLQLAYSGDYGIPPAAYNYGSDTGETSTGANVAWGPDDGLTEATMTTGPSILSGLWGTDAPEGSPSLGITLIPGNAFLFFRYQGTGNSAFPFVSQNESAPTTEFSCYGIECLGVFYLMPGSYTLESELADYAPVSYVITIPEMSYLNISLSLAPSLGVYTPLWAFSNDEVASIATSGGGTPSSPYILFNNQYSPLASDFGLYNDYSFPVFPGVFLLNTNVSVELNNSSSFETDTNVFQASPGQSLPLVNDLQLWFWNVTHVALVNDSNISGWFGAQDYFPLTFNSFNVVFYASEDNLIANNRWLTQSQALLLYANGTLYGPPTSTGGNNTVWGNEIVQVTPPPTCIGPAKCLPLLPYSSGLGLEIGEGYDLIYDNLVETPTTAWLLPLNLYTELPYEWTHDAWNIASQPASVVNFAPGFPKIPLGGSVVGGSTQGGNSWWDYGVALNWANGADNPTGVLPYNENASSLIDPIPGYGLPLPGYPCPTYYCASYIYPGGDQAPLTTIAAAVSIAPTGLPGATEWGVVISCQPAKSGGAGPAKSGGAGPAKSGGAGPCSGTTGSGGDPPPLVLADFTTTASQVNLVLPGGAYSWTPIVPNGYSSSLGGSFVVTGGTPAALSVPYAPPQDAVLTFAEQGLPVGQNWQVTANGVSESLTTDGGTDSVSFTVALDASYSYTISGIPGWHQSNLPYTGTVEVDTAPTTEPTLVYYLVSYPVEFSESGLTSGLTWSVTFNGILSTLVTDGGTDSLNFASEPNGTYSYAIASISGYQQSSVPYSGDETVSGESLLVIVSYTPNTFPVTFSESGLPPGLSWAVTFNGVKMSLSTDGGTDTLAFASEPSGTYAYSIAGVSGYHENTIPYTGTEVVNGAPLTVSVAFSQVTYSVTFSESGLPSGLTWQVTVGGTLKSLSTDGGTDSLTWTGLPNGTYAYLVTGNSGWHQTTLPYVGKVLVKGESVQEPALSYVRVTYSVTFFEVGLPAGLIWEVTVNGVALSTKTNCSLDWLTWKGLANGTYPYAITDNPGWHELTVHYTGNIVVNGGPIIELLVYYRVTYSVTFSESGLPAGFTWTVTVNGLKQSLRTNGGTDSLTWYLPNGTYAYSIAPISGWHQTTIPTTGNLVVNGAPVSEPTLTYSH